jgi:hypothetical protein
MCQSSAVQMPYCSRDLMLGSRQFRLAKIRSSIESFQEMLLNAGNGKRVSWCIIAVVGWVLWKTRTN